MDLKIYCSWCNEHAFKIDRKTAARAGLMSLTCPDCQRTTTIRLRASVELSASPSGEPGTVRAYQEYMARLTAKYDRHLFIAKKGEILLWHGMLLHGGCEIKNPDLTRKSYVIHYIPPGMNVGNDIAGPFNW